MEAAQAEKAAMDSLRKRNQHALRQISNSGAKPRNCPGLPTGKLHTMTTRADQQVPGVSRNHIGTTGLSRS